MTYDEFQSMPARDRHMVMQQRESTKISIAKRKLVRGIGCNDAGYVVFRKIDGKGVVCPAYKAWSSMIMRVADEKYVEKNKTYLSATICDEWTVFSAFLAWWKENYIDGFHLDKDILSDYKIYSPGTCIYVPQWVNNFAIDTHEERREVERPGRSNAAYYARCRDPMRNGLTLSSGPFRTYEEARSAWVLQKLDIAARLKHTMDAIDPRIYVGVVRMVIGRK